MNKSLTLIHLACALGLAVLVAAPVGAQVLGHTLQPASRALSSAERAQIEATAVPQWQIFTPSRAGAIPEALAIAPEAGAPMISEGDPGTAVRITLDERDLRALGAAPFGGSAETVEDYGLNLRNTMYHYSDALVPFTDFAPVRSVGRLFLQLPAGGWSWCTAALISRAILVTAGHCVNEGGQGPNAGWVQGGYFVPAFSNNDGGNHRYGRCEIRNMYTTAGWLADGNLNEGDDVALVVCSRTSGATQTQYNNVTPGFRLGFLPFCYQNCRWNYQMFSQLGYPGNYYGGGEMTHSLHLSQTRQNAPNVGTAIDFVYGTGMEGGSSGGPHIANLGAISDSALAGYYTRRSVIFAVTSWAFSGSRIKLGGASPLSGFNNGNNFRTMFNTACTRSRQLHGTASCTMLP